MAVPQVGHLDAAFLSVMEDTKDLLRYVWQTKNAFSIPVSGTGSAAMEVRLPRLVDHTHAHAHTHTRKHARTRAHTHARTHTLDLTSLWLTRLPLPTR